MEELTPGDIAVTEEDWSSARSRKRRASYASAAIGILVGPLLVVLALYLASLIATGNALYLATAMWMAIFSAPLAVILSIRNVKEQDRSDGVIATLAGQFEAQARGQKFESRLANALDMAKGEPEVVQVIERSFSTIVPDAPIELLLADNSHAHLLRMASSSPTGSPPACGVDSPDHCPAARRAQIQRFSDSEELDACPKLQGRPEGSMSAMCVPVSIMGRSVGVIHVTGKQHTAFSDNTEQDLETLAKLSGARIGLLRVMAETQLQATTDSLTGLLNRRSFEHRLAAIRREQSDIVISMADLDHFKLLNDSYGHETGDRALRLFAQVLRDSLRTEDLVCRHGGEEFSIAIPGCTIDKAHEIFEATRWPTRSRDGSRGTSEVHGEFRGRPGRPEGRSSDNHPPGRRGTLPSQARGRDPVRVPRCPRTRGLGPCRIGSAEQRHRTAAQRKGHARPSERRSRPSGERGRQSASRSPVAGGSAVA